MSNSHHPNDELDQFVDDYLSYLDGSTAKPDLGALSPGVQLDARRYVETLEQLSGAATTIDLETDAVALRLGFDRAGSDTDVDGTRIRALRQAAGLQLKELAARVNAAGGSTSTAELSKVERSKAFPVAQPTLSAISAVLNADVSEFESFEAQVDELRQLLRDDEIERVITEWATEHQRDVSTVRAQVHRQVLVGQFRAAGVSREQLTSIVQAILGTLQ